MKFSVAPESTRICRLALECDVLNRVGIRRLLYLHLKTLLIPKACTQAVCQETPSRILARRTRQHPHNSKARSRE